MFEKKLYFTLLPREDIHYVLLNGLDGRNDGFIRVFLNSRIAPDLLNEFKTFQDNSAIIAIDSGGINGSISFDDNAIRHSHFRFVLKQNSIESKYLRVYSNL